MAIQNIINSNRSANSAGVAIPQAANSVSNAVGKKFQAFKFNLTLNKGSKGGLEAAETSQQAFY